MTVTITYLAVTVTASIAFIIAPIVALSPIVTSTALKVTITAHMVTVTGNIGPIVTITRCPHSDCHVMCFTYRDAARRNIGQFGQGS